MREIKFRAWDKTGKGMGKVNYIKYSDVQYNQISARFKQKEKTVDDWFIYGDENGCDNIILMQYTGLKDRNGKEIYEGDIIRFTWEEDSCWGKQGTYTAYIRFNRGTFEVVYIGKKYLIEDGNQTGSDGLNYFMDWSEDVEVVGDIYTTPELLKAGE